MRADRCPVCDDISDHGPGEVACLRRAQVRRDDDLLTRCLAAEAARDEATRRLAEEKATVAAQSLDLFGAIDAQDKAERRLAVVEEAVRQAVTDLNFAAATRSIMLVDRAIDDLNAVIHTEKQP